MAKCNKVILLQSVTGCSYKVRQVLQSVTGCYYKVRQLLQSVTVKSITRSLIIFEKPRKMANDFLNH